MKMPRLDIIYLHLEYSKVRQKNENETKKK